jgi:DNA-binding transcriptional MerR regulator
LRLVPTPVVSKLTGLSTETLREWTRRRAVVPADVRPKQKGSPAQFTWQTVLVLRVAVHLRDQFHLELEAHKASFANLKHELETKSFIELWGQQLALRSDGSWELVGLQPVVLQGDLLLLELDPHLHVLRDGFAMPDDKSMRGQLDLFSLPNVHRLHDDQASIRPESASRRKAV